MGAQDVVTTGGDQRMQARGDRGRKAKIKGQQPLKPWAARPQCRWRWGPKQHLRAVAIGEGVGYAGAHAWDVERWGGWSSQATTAIRPQCRHWTVSATENRTASRQWPGAGCCDEKTARRWRSCRVLKISSGSGSIASCRPRPTNSSMRTIAPIAKHQATSGIPGRRVDLARGCRESPQGFC